MNLELGLILSVVLSAIPVIYLLIFLIRELSLKEELLLYVLSIFVIIITYFSSLAFIYPILNLVYNYEIISGNWLDQELANGLIGLRISSVIIGITSLIYTIETVTSESLFSSKRILTKQGKFQELSNLSIHISGEDLNYIIIGQYGFYLLIIIMLWISSILDCSNTLLLIINWALFFIIDDWAIISRYAIETNGRIFSTHRIRINIFNIALLLLSSFYTLQMFGGIWMFVFLGIVGLIFSFRYGMDEPEKDKKYN